MCKFIGVVRLVLLGVVLASLHPSLSGAVMLPLSVEELTGRAEKVVLGDVVEKESFWSEDGSMIMTSVQVEVQEVVKGSVGEQLITVEQPGGEVGDLGMRVSDMAPFERGERVLLFLKASQSRRGQAQGRKMQEGGLVFHVVGQAH